MLMMRLCLLCVRGLIRGPFKEIMLQRIERRHTLFGVVLQHTED